MRLPSSSRPLLVLVLLFLALGTLYSVVTPIFEAGDEGWHYPFVQWLATGHGLPVQDPANKGLWEQEGGQPPLYYALVAAATSWIDTGDLQERLWRNPFARIGIPLAFGNKNLIVHTSAEDFPWHNTTLTVHLIRFLSLLLSVGTIVLTYLLGRELLANQAASSRVHDVALAAAALVAFNPMFLFISASVNNDNLATLLAAQALLLTVQLVTRGPGDRRLLTLGIVAGLGALAKVSDLALLPLAGLTVLWLAWKRGSIAWLIRASLLGGLPALAIAGWWYARNYALYGDPLAFNVFVQVAGARPPISPAGLAAEFQGFRISFWGNFGGVNLIAGDWVYRVLDLFSLAGLTGLVWGAARRRLPALLLLPTLWLILIMVSLIRWTLLTYASQGRLIFPAISAIAVLLTFGLDQFTPGVAALLHKLPVRLTLQPAYLLPAFMLAFAATAPFLIISPAYALPARLPADAEIPNPVHIQYAASGRPELAGYEIGRSVLPGRELPVTLYWSAPAVVDEDLYAYIHLYGADGKLIGQWDALPGNGLYPARLWQPGEIIVDRYRVPVSVAAEGASIGRMEVGLTRVNSVTPVLAFDPEGREITPNIASFKISAVQSSSALPALYRFGDSLELLQFDLAGKRGITEFEVSPPTENALTTPLRPGDLLRGTLMLRARRIPPRDYVLFVHLIDGSSHIVSQWDKQPQQGKYPTSFWDAGEEVRDEFSIQVPQDAPAGDYRIELGYYSPENGERLGAAGDPYKGLRAAGDHLEMGPLPLEK